jgi:rhamnosyltransferase
LPPIFPSGGASHNFFRLIRDVNFDSFDYISLADQDDIWFDGKLLRSYDILSCGHASGYSSNCIASWPNGKKNIIRKNYPQKSWDYLFESAGPGCTYVIDVNLAKCLKKFLFLRRQFTLKIDYHDWLIYAYSRYNGFTWIIDSYEGMHYRQHSQNHTGANFGLLNFYKRVFLVLDGYGFIQAKYISLALGCLELLPVKNGLNCGRAGYLWLFKNTFKCRRKKLDCLYFSIVCIIFYLR